MRKQNPAFTELLHYASAALKEDGMIDSIVNQWYLSGATEKLYSDFNQIILNRQIQPAPDDPHLYTFNQVKQHGWKVRKGAKSAIVVYAGDEPVGKVRVDKDTHEVLIETLAETHYVPRTFRVFTLNDIEKDK